MEAHTIVCQINPVSKLGDAIDTFHFFVLVFTFSQGSSYTQTHTIGLEKLRAPITIRNTLTSKNIQICKFISILMYLKMLCCECLYIVYLETSGYCTCVHYIKTWHYCKEKYFCFLPPYFGYDAIQIK